MNETDVAAVVELERDSQLYPWPATMFRRLLRSNAVCLVIVCQGVVAGFGIAQNVKRGVHVMNMCVAAPLRGRGYGRKLLERLLIEARARGGQWAWLEVRPDNLRARALYRRMGFRTQRIRLNYYPARGGRQHALVMVRRL
jgi:ribosomal-protein-alanine N-acetyltransferase